MKSQLQKHLFAGQYSMMLKIFLILLPCLVLLYLSGTRTDAEEFSVFKPISSFFWIAPENVPPSDTLNSIPQPLPLIQHWDNSGLITANDNWSGVPGIEGYFLRNDGVSTSGVDPRTILGDTFGAGTTTVELDVTANQAEATSTVGGISEFDQPPLGNPFFYPTVGLQASETVDAPFLLIYLY